MIGGRAGRALLRLAVVALAACTQRPADDVPLERALAGLAGAAPAARERTVASWKLSRAAWQRTVVAPYDVAYDDYARAFDAAAPALAAQLAHAGAIATRDHYAGDPRLTRGQARARWALPVQYPSEVATLGDAPIDAVFVRDGGAWRAIVGVDEVVLARTAALRADCAPLLAQLGSKACQEVGWAIADAALRGDRARLDHACSLARTQCAN